LHVNAHVMGLAGCGAQYIPQKTTVNYSKPTTSTIRSTTTALFLPACPIPFLQGCIGIAALTKQVSSLSAIRVKSTLNNFLLSGAGSEILVVESSLYRIWGDWVSHLTTSTPRPWWTWPNTCSAGRTFQRVCRRHSQPILGTCGLSR